MPRSRWQQVVGALSALKYVRVAEALRLTHASHVVPLQWVGVGIGLAFAGIAVSFASFLAWTWLLRRYLASRLGVFSFLTLVFGVVLGIGLLGEPLEPGFAAVVQRPRRHDGVSRRVQRLADRAGAAIAQREGLGD